MDDGGDELGGEGGIEGNGFTVRLTNPQKMDVSWYLYEGNQLLQKGAGKECEFEKFDVDENKIYYAELFYLLGEEGRVKRRTFTANTSHLSVDVNLPERVYPGQTVDAEIRVLQPSGKPAVGVELTAFAVTRQLNYHVYDSPSYGCTLHPREQRATFDLKDKAYHEVYQIAYSYLTKSVARYKPTECQFTAPI